MTRSSHSPSAFSVVVSRKNVDEPLSRSSRHYAYEPGGYHPVGVGDVYDRRYQVVEQLGWGQHSTVWLVQDIQSREPRQAAMKVLIGDLSKTTRWDECGMLRALRDQNPRALGHGHICQLVDDFVTQGPNGSHICIVTELLGPTALDICYCLSAPMPLFLVKRLSKHLLLALQYMHDCNIVHTDIKSDNIFMTGAPPPVAPAAVQLHQSDFMAAKFKLGDMGLANKMSNRYAALIQPEGLRSPEVIIGAEWDIKADIWNFGCVICEFTRGGQLFDPGWDVDQSSMSRPQTHLAQMVGLLGVFPQSLIQRGKHAKDYFNDGGHLLCWRIRYYNEGFAGDGRSSIAGHSSGCRLLVTGIDY